MNITYNDKIAIRELYKFINIIPKEKYAIYITKNIDNMFVKLNNSILEKINVILHKALEKIKIDFTINFVVFNDGYMFNLPFTLGNTIFFPLECINREETQNIKTVIHEIIHIMQRTNINFWNEYIISQNNWTLHNFCILDNVLNNNYIVNPDSFYSGTWLYKNKYYCHCILQNNKIVNQWYIFENNNSEGVVSRRDGKFVPINENIYKYEHPFEEYAYVLSEKYNLL